MMEGTLTGPFGVGSFSLLIYDSKHAAVTALHLVCDLENIFASGCNVSTTIPHQASDFNKRFKLKTEINGTELTVLSILNHGFNVINNSDRCSPQDYDWCVLELQEHQLPSYVLPDLNHKPYICEPRSVSLNTETVPSENYGNYQPVAQYSSLQSKLGDSGGAVVDGDDCTYFIALNIGTIDGIQFGVSAETLVLCVNDHIFLGDVIPSLTKLALWKKLTPHLLPTITFSITDYSGTVSVESHQGKHCPGGWQGYKTRDGTKFQSWALSYPNNYELLKKIMTIAVEDISLSAATTGYWQIKVDKKSDDFIENEANSSYEYVTIQWTKEKGNTSIAIHGYPSKLMKSSTVSSVRSIKLKMSEVGPEITMS